MNNQNQPVKKSRKLEAYSFYHVVIIPDWDPEINYMETRKFASYDNAVKYMKNNILTKEERSNLTYEGSGCKGESYRYNTVYFDENGNEIEEPEEFDEEKHNYHDYTIEIVEGNEEEEEEDE